MAVMTKKSQGDDHLGVSVDEGEPALLWIGRAHRSAPAQILRDRARGNSDSQFQLQLVGDAFLSPGGIVCGHLADQRLEVVR